MTPEVLFKYANIFAMLGWLVLILGVVLNRELLRDRIAGLYWPLALSAGYCVALYLGFGTTGGSFETLPGVRQLFSGDWTLLAGWVHYLAFDLFIGAWIARDANASGVSRWFLIPVLPLTFLFGPVGFLLFHVFKAAFAKVRS